MQKTLQSQLELLASGSFIAAASDTRQPQPRLPLWIALFIVLRIDAPSMAPTLVSPMTSPLHTPSTTPTEVSLDLTVPHPQFSMANTIEATNEPTSTEIYSSTPQSYRNHSSYLEDPDILAGCRALLSFSHGLHSLTAA